MAGGREEEDQSKEERARALVLCDGELGQYSGGYLAEIVPYAREGREVRDHLLGVSEGSSDLAEVVHHRHVRADAAALREVADAGDGGAGVGEGVGVGARGDVEADVPDARRARELAGDGEPHHEVAEEVEGGADGEDHPGRRDFVDEAGEEADVGAEVLGEADEVERRLVVAEGGFDVV